MPFKYLEIQLGLYEDLCETFPLEDVHPYGLVLIVPREVFQKEWEAQLKNEGVQVYTNHYNGRVCFFLRKKDDGNNNNEAVKVEGSQLKPLEWNEETFKLVEDMRRQGLSYRRIAEKLRQMGFKASHSCLQRRMKEKDKVEPKVEDCQTDLIGEFIEALKLLYPRHRRVALFLIQNASKLVEACDSDIKEKV